MAGKRRKVEPPAEEGAPAWMNTYGDMVTLVLTFFVLLFSFSTIDAKKWEEIVNSFSGTRIVAIAPLDPGEVPPYNNETENEAGNDNEISVSAGNIEEQKEAFDQLYAQIRQHIIENKLETQLNVTKNEYVITLRITDTALFDSGKDVIKPGAKPMLQEISKIINAHDDVIKKITIEGHTDNVPISSARFRDNWDLSSCRAGSALQFVKSVSDIDSAKFAICGYGEYRPVAPNDTKEGQAKNRRVDFVIESIAKID